MLKHGNFFLHCFQNTGINTYKLKLFAKNADSDEEELEVDLNYNVYNHIAVVKQDYNYSLFVNGTKIGTVEWTTSYNSNTHIIFGSLNDYDSYYIHEYIDEIRFSDIARYTDSFDVPNNPYGQAVADNRTLTELIEDLEKEKQLKVLPTNIRNQITILGVTGNLIPGIDTSDANATADDIRSGKSAYVNGEKINGEASSISAAFGDSDPSASDVNFNDSDSRLECITSFGASTIFSKGAYVIKYIPYNAFVEKLGLTPEKLVSGNTLLGVTGTAKKLDEDIKEYTNVHSLSEGSMGYVDSSFGRFNVYLKSDSLIRAGSGAYLTYAQVVSALELTPDKIVEGNSILGVEGTATIGIDTTDATATVNDLVSGKTAYVNGEKITGSLIKTDLQLSDLQELGIDISGAVSGNTFVACDNDNTSVCIYTPMDLCIGENSYFPATMSNNKVSEAIGLTADKIVQGNTILGIIGTGGAGTEYESLSRLGTAVTDVQLLEESNFVTLSGVVSDTGIVTEDETTFVAGESYSKLAKTIGLTADKLVEGNTILGVEGTATTGVDINDYYNLTSLSSNLKVAQLIKTIPEINTNGVTSMNAMFYGCTNLETIPAMDTSNVTDMTSMFANCSNLVTIPQLNMNKVSDITGMFSNCNSLSEDSLNNILISLATIEVDLAAYKKTLVNIGLSDEQINICITLPSWENCTANGWLTGN